MLVFELLLLLFELELELLLSKGTNEEKQYSCCQ
jgi:hypothetical protein